MRIRGRILCFFFLLTSALSYAQSWSASVQGRVVGLPESEPLVGAAIRVLTLPDSVFVEGLVTNDEGDFYLRRKPEQELLLVISYLGYKTQDIALPYAADMPHVSLGTIALTEEAVELKEAVVVGKVPDMVLKEDTVEYNAQSYKLPPDAMVNDLIKKLPGIQVDQNGSILVGGKPITRILVDGKEFFGSDLTVALNNLSADILDKLQVIDRKSEEARTTGVDDGEEEKVINLTIKKDMKKGWFGNTSVGAGGTLDQSLSQIPYQGRIMINRFIGDNQVSLLAGMNNTNQFTFSNGGAEMDLDASDPTAGINTAADLGVNFAYFKDKKFSLRGSILGNASKNDVDQLTNRENILSNSSTFYQQAMQSRDKQKKLSADFEMRWDIDSLTRLIIRPDVRFDGATSRSLSDSYTQREDSTYINQGVNAKESDRSGIDYQFQATLVRSSKRKAGRRVSVTASVSGRESDASTFTNSETYYGDERYDPTQVRDTTIRQNQRNENGNLAYRFRFTYVEPLKNKQSLQLAYSLNQNNSYTNRLTYNWDERLDDYTLDFDTAYSDLVDHRVINQNLSFNFRSVRKKYNYLMGISIDPSSTKSVNRIDDERSYDRHVVNWGPSLHFNYMWTQHKRIRLMYNGRTRQPSITDLQPAKNISNPLYIREGNMDLLPSYNSTFSFNYSRYYPESQRSLSLYLRGGFVTNSIVNKTTYFEDTGVRIVKPVNVNGQWDVSASNNLYLPFADNAFKFYHVIETSFRQRVGFINELQNLSQTFSISDRFYIQYSTEKLELEWQANYTYDQTHNTISKANNLSAMNFGSSLKVLCRLPKDVSLGSNFSYLGRIGYAKSIAPHVFLWNVQANYAFLKEKKANLFVRLYDILQQQRATQRNITSAYIEDVQFNALTSYFMVGFSYRINTMGAR